MLVIWNRVIWRPPHTALGQERAHSDHFAATHIASTILKQGFVWKVKLFIQSKKKSKLHQYWDIFQFNYKFAQFTLSSLKICSKCLMRNPWLDGRTSAQAEQTPLIHTAASYIFNANRIEAFHSPCSIMMVGVVGFLAHFQDSEFFIITAVIRHSNYIFSKDWVRLTFCQF